MCISAQNSPWNPHFSRCTVKFHFNILKSPILGLYKPLVRENKHAGKFAYQLENSIFFVFIGFLKYWFSAKYKRNSNYFSKPLIFLRLVRRKVWSYAKKAVTSCKNTTKDCKVFDNIVKRLYSTLQHRKTPNQLVYNLLK